VKKKFQILVFTLYVGLLGHGTRYSKVTASVLPQSTFFYRQPQPFAFSCHFLMQPSGDQ